jgi:hypothetical protein
VPVDRLVGVVPRVTHLFEEPGTLGTSARRHHVGVRTREVDGLMAVVPSDAVVPQVSLADHLDDLAAAARVPSTGDSTTSSSPCLPCMSPPWPSVTTMRAARAARQGPSTLSVGDGGRRRAGSHRPRPSVGGSAERVNGAGLFALPRRRGRLPPAPADDSRRVADRAGPLGPARRRQRGRAWRSRRDQ